MMKGRIRLIDGIILKEFPNTILKSGINMIMDHLIGDSSVTIDTMVFGDGGSGKKVDFERSELFGVTRIAKPVVIKKDIANKQIIASAILEKSDGAGFTLNEMGLRMSNGELFAMSIFEDYLKTEMHKLTWEWEILL